MGWITTHRDKGISNDAYFQENVIGGQRTIVASSTIKGVYYAAVREDTTGEVWALIVLTHRAPNSDHNFGWKSMTEDMGPGVCDAPAKVLDELTETTNEYALEWRAACRKNLELKSRTLADNTEIRLPSPLGFQLAGSKRLVWTDHFVYRPQPRCKDTFLAFTEDRGSFLVRLPDWRKYAFEIISEETEV
jgi:hypothetical protein